MERELDLCPEKVVTAISSHIGFRKVSKRHIGSQYPTVLPAEETVYASHWRDAVCENDSIRGL